MNNQIIKNIIITTIPLFAYIIADIIFNNSIISIIIAVIIGATEFLVHFLIYKKMDYFVFFDVLFIVLFGIISILLDNPLYFKLKPAIIEAFLLIFITVTGFSKKFFNQYMTRFTKNFSLSEQQLQQMQFSLFIFIPVLILHISLIVIAAFFFSNSVWAFISGVLLYIIFGSVFVVLFFARWLQKKLVFNRYKNEEWFDIVDEKSRVIGKAPRSICHNGSKLLHPVVHVHILNSKNMLLLQKRAMEKDIQPGKWDTSVGGHIHSGEPLDQAVFREVKEEAGIELDMAKVVPLANYIYESDVEKELVFSFIYLTDDLIKHQESEIDEVAYFSKDQLEQLILDHKTTPNFIREYKILKEKKVF